MLQLSLQWLREFQRNRTFFETLLEITSAIVFPSSTKIDAGQFIEEVPNRETVIISYTFGNNFKQQSHTLQAKEILTEECT